MSNTFTNIWKSRASILTNKPNWRNFLKNSTHLCFVIRIPLSKKEYLGLKNELRKVSDAQMIRRNKLHVTLKQAGFYTSKKSNSNKRRHLFTKKELLRISYDAKNIISKYRSFTISISKVNIFSDVMFLEIKKNKSLINIHKELCNIKNIPFASDRDGSNYLPHVAFAQLDEGIEHESIRVANKLRDKKFKNLKVTEIELIGLKLNKKNTQLYPSIKTISVYKLK